jgi:hypothetical protein
MKRSMISRLVLLFILVTGACAPVPEPTATEAQSAPNTEAAPATSTSEDTATSEPEPTDTEPAVTKAIPVTGHLLTPAEDPPPFEKLAYDVESGGRSAPYGDSYRINRFERPFRQDMTYVPALDILRFELGADDDWYYISIVLNGSDPNHEIGIQYGVEIDRDADGFGDTLIWASPPYTTQWSTGQVQVYEDSDQDTGGLSSSQADAPFEGNGYDSQVFDGGGSENEDPDLAWVRTVEGAQALIQFAFKKSLAGATFVAGVIADAGLKDVTQFDYNDRFEASQAGSPLRNDPNYPLGPLFGVDNTCWQTYNLDLTTYPPKFCPPESLPVATRRPPSRDPAPTGLPPTTAPQPTDPDPTEPEPTEPQPTEPEACVPTFDPADCGDLGYNPDTCQCNPEPAPTEPEACVPTFDPADCGDLGYDPDICQCNPPEPEPTEPEACVPTFDPADCGDIGYDPETCQCNPEP